MSTEDILYIETCIVYNVYHVICIQNAHTYMHIIYVYCIYTLYNIYIYNTLHLQYPYVYYYTEYTLLKYLDICRKEKCLMTMLYYIHTMVLVHKNIIV